MIALAIVYAHFRISFFAITYHLWWLITDYNIRSEDKHRPIYIFYNLFPFLAETSKGSKLSSSFLNPCMRGDGFI